MLLPSFSAACQTGQEETIDLNPFWAALTLTVLICIQIGLVVRVFLRPHREPASRITWTVIIVSLPVVGIVGYLLFGEVNIGRKRIARMRQVISQLPDPNDLQRSSSAKVQANIPGHLAHLFASGRSVNGFDAVGGNTAELMKDSNSAIDAMVDDIDAATRHVHLCFYIWLPDGNGLKVAEALKRAAGRGVFCRAMADDLGSRTIIRSRVWQEMDEAGVKLVRALPVGNPILRSLKGRIDLRNHRKIVVIDNWITYCGSQNCADPEFLIKARFAPWVDAVMRFEGPIARQNQYLFVADWTAESGESLEALLLEPLGEVALGFPAQVIGTGPTVRWSAMPEVFETLMFGARRSLTISTPYYVPNESLQAALCASGRRGVDTRLVVPAVNDSWVVGAASRSCYYDLLQAGVRIFEYRRGLLHTKSLTIDGEVTLIGSANLDRRSFELNYENNILLNDEKLTADMGHRQQAYIDQSREVTIAEVAEWSRMKRLRNNAIALLGPVL